MLMKYWGFKINNFLFNQLSLYQEFDKFINFIVSIHWGLCSWTHKNSLFIFKWILTYFFDSKFFSILFIFGWISATKNVNFHLRLILNHHYWGYVCWYHRFLTLFVKVIAPNYTFLKGYIFMVWLTSINVPLSWIILLVFLLSLSWNSIKRLLIESSHCISWLIIFSWLIDAWKF